jgi:hypothetical protein
MKRAMNSVGMEQLTNACETLIGIIQRKSVLGRRRRARSLGRFWKNKYKISRKFVQREPSCYMHTAGRTEGHDEAYSRFSQFCERV